MTDPFPTICPRKQECGYLRLDCHDPEKHMARFYNLHLASTLFGGWDLVGDTP